MTVKLHGAGAAHARNLINSGKYDDSAAWSFSAEDGDKLLGPGGDDWTAYSDMHLGEDTDEADRTKARWKYPFGKNGKVYGAALRAIRSRASQQDATAIYDEAGKLLDLIKSKEGKDARRVVPFARTAPMAAGYRMVAKADAGEIFLYGDIGASFWGGGISADQFRQDLRALGSVKTIDLRINSDGGDVFAANAMYALLNEHPAEITTHVDGLAASAATLVAMAGAEIKIAESAFMMIHNPAGMTFGTVEDHQRQIDLLKAVAGTMIDLYAGRTKQPADQIKAWMDAETWMTGKEAVANGFADTMVGNMAMAASVRDPAKFRNLPAALRPNRAAALALIGRS